MELYSIVRYSIVYYIPIQRLLYSRLMISKLYSKPAIQTTNHGYSPLHLAREKLHLSQARLLLGFRRAEDPDGVPLLSSSSSVGPLSRPSSRWLSPLRPCEVVSADNSSDIILCGGPQGNRKIGKMGKIRGYISPPIYRIVYIFSCG